MLLVGLGKRALQTTLRTIQRRSSPIAAVASTAAVVAAGVSVSSCGDDSGNTNSQTRPSSRGNSLLSVYVTRPLYWLIWGDDKAETDAERTEMVTAAQIEAFQKMVKKAGATTNGVALHFGDNGRGLFSTASHEPGDLLISVPSAMCLIHTAGEETEDAAIDAKSSRITRTEMHNKLSTLPSWPLWQGTRLLRASQKGFWHEYATLLLPSREDVEKSIPIAMPNAWSEKFGDRFASVRVARRFQQHIAQQYNQIVGSEQSVPLPAGLRWAVALCISRCFGLSPDNEIIGMVPFVDFCNHAFDSNVALSLEKNGSMVCVRATKHIPENAELFIKYAESASNEELFTKFGFATKDNPFDIIRLGSEKMCLDPQRFEEWTSGLDATELNSLEISALRSIPLSASTVSLQGDHESIQLLKSEINSKVQSLESDANDPMAGPLRSLIDVRITLLAKVLEVLEVYDSSN